MFLSIFLNKICTEGREAAVGSDGFEFSVSRSQVCWQSTSWLPVSSGCGTFRACAPQHLSPPSRHQSLWHSHQELLGVDSQAVTLMRPHELLDTLRSVFVLSSDTVRSVSS